MGWAIPGQSVSFSDMAGAACKGRRPEVSGAETERGSQSKTASAPELPERRRVVRLERIAHAVVTLRDGARDAENGRAVGNALTESDSRVATN